MRGLRHLLEVTKSVNEVEGIIVWNMVFYNENFPNIVERKQIIENVAPIQPANETEFKEDTLEDMPDVNDDINIPIITEDIEELRN